MLGDGVAARLICRSSPVLAAPWATASPARSAPRPPRRAGRAAARQRRGAISKVSAFGLAARDVYEQARLAFGVPDGSRDLVVERSTLLESGFEELGGVDFAKGCFVGQELTARMKYRGLVRKRLLPVILKGPRPEPGTIIRLGEREAAGEMRSSIDGHGLALLRLDRVAEADGSAWRWSPARPRWCRSSPTG